MPLQRTKSLMYITVVGAFLATSAAGALFFLTSVLNNSIGSIEEELLSRKQQEEIAQNGKRLLEVIKVEREKLNSYLVAKDGAVSFIEQIEALARHTNVDLSVEGVGALPLSDSKTFEYLTLQADGEGSFRNVYWLLSLIEQLPHSVTINSLSLGRRTTAEPQKTLEDSWEITFNLSARKLK